MESMIKKSNREPVIKAHDFTTLYQSCRQYLRAYREVSVAHRLQEVKKLQQIIYLNSEKIVAHIMDETGKSRTDALVSEVMGVLDYCEWILKHGKKILADKTVSTPIALFGKKSKIYHEPVGVTLIIAPWNYPFHIGMTSIIGAFVAGNCVIYKPSEHTSFLGLFEEIFSSLPLLSQAAKIVYGDGNVAQKLIDCRPDKIFFTGSTRTGKKILQQAAPLLIPVDLELGGKDAMIVFDDVDLDRTAAGALWGALTNAGQSCTSVERLYVQQNIYTEFVNKLKENMEQLVINNHDCGNADIGGITTDFQYEIIKRHVDDARNKGATIHCGGEPLDATASADDKPFYPPTLITDVDNSMLLIQEETFGPVLPVIPFTDEDEVITHCNNSEFGLSASVWSKDLKRADRVARAIEVGAVSINNVMLTEGNPALPFGGTKNSGFGRSKGAEGLLSFTRSKSVLFDKQSKKIEANWYPYTQKKYELFQGLISALFNRTASWLARFAVAGIALESEAQKKRF